MAHANNRDPYAPVKVNRDGKMVVLSNASKRQDQSSQQDQVIAKTLSTIGPLASQRAISRTVQWTPLLA